MKFSYKLVCLLALGLFFVNFLYNATLYNVMSSIRPLRTTSSPQPISLTVKKKARIFCMILTSAISLKTEKPGIIYETWAKKCDKYKFISKIPDELLSQNDNVSAKYGIELDYGFDVLQPPGLVKDSYDKLTDKVLLTFKYLYNKYGDYDWYLKADDDSFIFVDNLREFVADKNASMPVTYGYDFKVIVEKGYHSGGGGYLLSREALHRIGSNLNKSIDFCKNSGTEDVDVAICLRELGVYPKKSIDALGLERFHPLSLRAHYSGDYPDWMFQYASNPLQKVSICVLCVLFYR